MAITLRYFAEFGNLRDQLRKSGGSGVIGLVSPGARQRVTPIFS